MRVANAFTAALLANAASAAVAFDGSGVYSVVTAGDQGEKIGMYTHRASDTSLHMHTSAVKRVAGGLGVDYVASASDDDDAMLMGRQLVVNCGCGPDACCVESGGGHRCIDFVGSICPSPYGDATTEPIPAGTGEVFDFGNVMGSASESQQGKTLPETTPLTTGMTTTAYVIRSRSMSPETLPAPATMSVDTDPSCDARGCCLFPPHWTACVGDYLESAVIKPSSVSTEPSASISTSLVIHYAGTGVTALENPSIMTAPRNSQAAQQISTLVVVQPVVQFSKDDFGTDKVSTGFTTLTTTGILPRQTFGFKTSQDGSCGSLAGTTCVGSKWGDCCGLNATCGSGAGYCAPSNCMPGNGQYGICWPNVNGPDTSTMLSIPLLLTSYQSVAMTGNGPATVVSQNDTCGRHANQTCDTSSVDPHSHPLTIPGIQATTVSTPVRVDPIDNVMEQESDPHFHHLTIPGIHATTVSTPGRVDHVDNIMKQEGDPHSHPLTIPGIHASTVSTPGRVGPVNNIKKHEGVDLVLLDERDATTVAQATVHTTVTGSAPVVYLTDTPSSSSDTVAEKTSVDSSVASASTSAGNTPEYSLNGPAVPTMHEDKYVSIIVATTVTEYVAADGTNGDFGGMNASSTKPVFIPNNVTLTNPLNPAATTVVPANYTRPIIKNTSIDTNIYVNISTFRATGLTIASSGAYFSLSEGFSDLETVTSNDATETSGSAKTGTFVGGPQSFAPAATTNVDHSHNLSSRAVKATEVQGSSLLMLAALGVAGVFGLMLFL